MKTIHREIKKEKEQIFGKQIFAGPYGKTGFSDGPRGKESTCQSRRYKRHGFDPWVGKIPGVRNGNPLQYSCLENSKDRRNGWRTVHGLSCIDHVTDHVLIMFGVTH